MFIQRNYILILHLFNTFITFHTTNQTVKIWCTLKYPISSSEFDEVLTKRNNFKFYTHNIDNHG